MVSHPETGPTPELGPSDIRRIRERLGLTQVEAGELLGGGPRAFTKYENGAIKPAASVVTLLRLLEKSPQELQTIAGPRTIPIENDGHSPLEVSADHIQALSPRKFALLFGRLLAAEAFACDLPMDGIHVAAQITVGDGGEDARIEWQEGPQRTTFLPGRLVQFQLKATKITTTAVKREVVTPAGAIKPMVAGVLAAGGTYVLCVSHPLVKQTIKKHETELRKILREFGLIFGDEQVVLRDGSQVAIWVNTRRSVAAWVLAQTQPNLIGPFRDWNQWANRFEHQSSPFIDDPRLEQLSDKLRTLVTPVQGVARIVGPSGVGKSRLVMEAFGPDMIEEASGARLSSIVLYVVEPEVEAAAVKSAVQHLADSGSRVIVVVDRCDPETCDILTNNIKQSGSRLSLVTIDHELSEDDEHREGTIVVPKADEKVVDGVVGNVAPALEKDERQRVAQLAGGNPQAARMFAEVWERGSLVAAGSEALINRVLYGHSAFDKDLLRKSAMLLSAFGLVGFRKPADSDLAALATLPGAPSEDELRAAFEDLARRGVAQPRGRLLSLQPAPLSQPLALRQWRTWGKNTWDFVACELADVALRRRALRLLTRLNREPSAIEVAHYLCRLSGPFASIENLGREGAAEAIAQLAEIDAEAVVVLLETVFEPLSLRDLTEVKGGTRRQLVWALEKVAFCAETFERGARLMLSLAEAENEQWGNNATGQFKGFFAVIGGNTESGPAARLAVLDDLIANDRALPLVIDALLAGADTSGGYRTIGAEMHGSRPMLAPWRPRYWNDAWDYVDECLKRIAKLAERKDEVGRKAKSGLGSKFRSLVAYRRLSVVEEVVASVISASGNYWPEALGSLGDILVYDSAGLQDGEEARVRALVALLQPTDIASRVRFLVTEMPWDYPVDEILDYEERGRRQIADVEALAAELLDQPTVLDAMLPGLSRGSHRMVGVFGRALGARASNPLDLFERIAIAYKSAPQDDANFGLLGGFLGSLAHRHPDRVASFKEEAATSRVFGPTLPFVCSCIGLVDSDIGLAIRAMNAGVLPIATLNAWAYGRALVDLTPLAIAPLFDKLFAGESEALSLGLILLGMYVHGDRGRLNSFRPQLRLVATNAGKRLSNPQFQMADHQFKEIMEWILAKGRSDSDASAIALSMATQIADASDNVSDGLIKPLLPRLLHDFPEVTWPIIGEAIVRDRKEAWRMEIVLAGDFGFQGKRPVILDLPEDSLFAWLHAHPDVAPAFAAGMLPVLTSRDPNDNSRTIHPCMRRLLNEFGQRDDVLKALTHNMHAFGWMGSEATYFALYERPLQELKSHPIGAVRRWAQATNTRLREMIKSIHNEEDERNANWEL